MRISREQAKLLKDEFYKIDHGCEVYLFGSRIDDNKRGGDIDIMVLTTNPISLEEKWKVQSVFQEKFGEQKIDIVNFSFSSEDSFKNLVLMDAVKL